jgi:hypothetical protein
VKEAKSYGVSRIKAVWKKPTSILGTKARYAGFQTRAVNSLGFATFARPSPIARAPAPNEGTRPERKEALGTTVLGLIGVQGPNERY